MSIYVFRDGDCHVYDFAPGIDRLTLPEGFIIDASDIRNIRVIQDPSASVLETLPKPGDIVEVRRKGTSNRYWCKGTIRYMSREAFVIETDTCQTGHNVQDYEVRKIVTERTPEQIASEEREKAINEMAEYLTHKGSFYDDAEILYNAGYRKVTP
jgi:hypothetical protein